METPELEEFFSRQWMSITTSCTDRMEAYDRRTIRSFRTFEDVQKHVIDEQDEAASEGALQELAMLQPRLVSLRSISDVFSRRLGPILNPDTFWGLLGLLLSVVLQQDEAMRRIGQMLKKLSRHCQDFETYSIEGQALTKSEKVTCFEVFVSMTRFLADAVQFLRQAGDISQLSHASGRNSWQELTETFSNVVTDIEESLKGIEKQSAASQSQKRESELASWLSFLSMSPRSFRDTAVLPCFILPQARTTRFFDRDDVIDKIEAHFGEERETLGTIRSLALYGMGGVGKSHVALKFAEKQRVNNQLDAIFWVQAENRVSMEQSFLTIASRLKLGDPRSATVEELKLTVQAWLQHTECKWLIVYDNVEDMNLLTDYWPLPGSKGSALITTRNHALAFDPADGGVEVVSWDTETGSRFLLHLLSGSISAELLANEAQSAYSLSAKLSGHALALNNMCGLIHRRSWTISELLKVFDGSHFFNSGLEAVWQLSFQNLSKNGSAMLSAFVLCAPDNIPHSLFELDPEQELPDDMLWYRDEAQLSEALEELLTLALVKRDRQTRTYTIHRVIQAEFTRFMTPDARQKAFCEASLLMYNVFPKRPDNKHAVLYDVWDRCQLWLQHVLNMKDSFRQERRRDPNFYAIPETCAVWSQCQRFLLEQQNWKELEDLVSVTRVALATLAYQDPQLWKLSATETHVSQMRARQGRYQTAIDTMLIAMDIKRSAPQVELQNISWNQHHLATYHVCTGQLDEALQWSMQAQETWKQWSEEAGVDFVWPAMQRRSHGGALVYSKRFDEGRQELNRAMDMFMNEDPLNWGEAAICKFTLARLEMFEGKLEAAETSFMEAQSLWLQGDASRMSVFNGATMYRMGCCALLQGNVEAALKHLQDAMAVTSVHAESFTGEHARCLFKMSEALYQVPGREIEADRLHKEAEKLYWKRVRRTQEAESTKAKDEDDDHDRAVTEDEYDALVFLYWR